MKRHLTFHCLLALAPLLAGCGIESRPDLLARVMQDCEGGNVDACSILRGMPSATAVQPASRPPRRMRSQVQQNLDALLMGVERARNTPRLPPGAVPENGPI